MNIYVLDTSALLAYIENEEGSSEVEKIILEALDQKHTIYISMMSCIEIFYISLREQNQKVAQERLSIVNDLPLNLVTIGHDDIISIGSIKAEYPMSLADCCIAGLAKKLSAILVHKDPEFEQLKGIIEEVPLPYKAK